MQKNIVALIPLRGGSKSIPRKNLKEIAGKPLFAWAIDTALESGVFSKVYVSTEDSEISAAINTRYVDRVSVVERPAEYATDTASTESVMLHFSSVVQFDVVCLLQVTSPMTRPDEIRGAYREFTSNGYDSLLSVVEHKRFHWSKEALPLNYDPARRPRRQEFAGCFMENGSFYFTTREILERCRNRLGGKTGLFVQPGRTAFEIDEPDDWMILESMLTHTQI